MALPAILFWLVLLGGLAFVVCMLWLATWAMFGDRSKGRLRCPSCWYDLTYSFSLTCSECGLTVASPRELMKRRRRWSLALLAVIALTCAGLFVADRLFVRGWASMAPTHAILFSLPFTNDYNSAPFRELVARQQRGELTRGDLASLIDRCVEGDWWARPPGEAWARKYGPLILRWRDTILAGSPLRDRLLELPARVELTTREVRPADEPIMMLLRVQDWWPQGTNCRVRLTPRTAGAQPVVLRHGRMQNFRTGIAIELPESAAAGPATIVDVEVERRVQGGGGESDRWRTAGRQSFTLQTRRAAPGETLLQAVRGDSDLDEMMQQVFRGMVTRWSAGDSPLRFRYEPSRTFTSRCDDMAIGAVVEVVRDDGAVARRLELWWRGGVIAGMANDGGRAFGWSLPREDLSLLAQVNDADGRWFMRVRGAESLALRAGGGTRFWSGEFTVPLTIQQLSGEAPEPTWWVED